VSLFGDDHKYTFLFTTSPSQSQQPFLIKTTSVNHNIYQVVLVSHITIYIAHRILFSKKKKIFQNNIIIKANSLFQHYTSLRYQKHHITLSLTTTNMQFNVRGCIHPPLYSIYLSLQHFVSSQR
jgi:hypothetical protein